MPKTVRPPCINCGSTIGDKRGACVECSRLSRKRYNDSHKKEKSQYGKSWYLSNKKRRMEKDREWRKNNPDKVKEIKDRYKKNNPMAGIISSKKYQRGHRESVLSCRRRWMNANREKTRESARRYRKKYPKRRNEQENLRRCRKMGNGGRYTESEWLDVCRRYGNRCLCCGRDDVQLTADHVVPIARGGSNDISNIQPLCRKCNSSKGARNSRDFRIDHENN